MQKKKLLTTLIITLLTLSIIAAFIPMASAQIAITTPAAGSDHQVGDKVLVSGSAASVGGLVEVFWENTASENKLNETYADGAGDYECYMKIREDTAGSHYIIVRDFSTGETVSRSINIIPKIELTPTAGLPDDEVDVAGKGFAATSNITILFTNATYSKDVTPEITESNALGSFSTTFVVPTVDYGPYTVNVTDAVNNLATADFNVTATITLTPDKGPTGTVVAITGRGFTEVADLDVTITVGGVTAPQVAPIKTKADGTFTGELIVPTLIVAIHNVIASDGTISGTESFNVTETTTITLDPPAGMPKWEVIIEGLYFTAIADTEVTVKFEALIVKTLYTDATGGFKGTFEVPSLDTGTYIVNATDANDLYATANFTVAITLIVLTPDEGPTGTVVDVDGYGFTAAAAYNVTLDGKLLKQPDGSPAEGTVSAIKRFTIDVVIFTVSVGDHDMTAMDENGLTWTEIFKVTETTELILTPSSGPTGYNVTVEANYFTAASGKSITFTIKNATWGPDSLTVSPTSPWTAVETNGTGSFKGTFLVPDIALDGYTINATDAIGLTVEVSFSVVIITVEMYTRALEYLQGDTISFYIECSFAYAVEISIEDPTGYPAAPVSVLTGDWLPMDGFNVVPYGKATFTLPSDAKTGTWSWEATIGTEKETDTFDVVVKPTLGTILDKLDELDAKLVSLDGTVATIETAVGTIETSVENINLKVVDIDGTVATIETDVGIIEGKVTSIEGNVATIQTDIGTVEADVSDILEDTSTLLDRVPEDFVAAAIDYTPIWIAVVFSILAFIGAIASAYMLRTKLA